VLDEELDAEDRVDEDWLLDENDELDLELDDDDDEEDDWELADDWLELDELLTELDDWLDDSLDDELNSYPSTSSATPSLTADEKKTGNDAPSTLLVLVLYGYSGTGYLLFTRLSTSESKATANSSTDG